MTQAKKSLADDTGFARAWSTLFGEYRGGARLLGLHGLEDAARARTLTGQSGVAEAYELMRAILGTQTAVLISRLEHELPVPQVARLTPPGAIEPGGPSRTTLAPFSMRGIEPAREVTPMPLPRVSVEPRAARPQMLGRFLLSSGRITLSELTDAILWQRAQRPAVGRIAMDWRILSSDQVVSVLREKPYNELLCAYAVRVGLMTPFHQTAIVAKQRRLQQPSGRYFVERGILTEAEVDEAATRARGR